MIPLKFAIVTTHPVQYYAPWFRHLSLNLNAHCKVFYLWQPKGLDAVDPEFGQSVRWDIPLTDGYEFEFIPNRAHRPGTHSVWGIHNPAAPAIIANWQPDVVVLLGYNFLTFYYLMLSPQLRRARFLLRGDSHRLFPQRGLRAMVKNSLIKAIFRRFDGALYCGSANRNYFTKMGIKKANLYFCPHGIDENRFKPAEEHIGETNQLRQSWGVPANGRVVLFSGKLIEKKRPQDLLSAFNQIKGNDFRLVFVGSGNLESDLRRHADSRVVFASFANQSKMPAIYRASDVMVLPSFGSSETWGLSVQEALACGCPVVVSDHVGCYLDLVAPHNNGAVFPAGDVSALRHILLQALTNPKVLSCWKENTAKPLGEFNYEMATKGLCEAVGAK